MTIRWGVAGVAALAVAGSLLAGCGSSDSKLSVDKLQKVADQARAAPKSPCPLGFDVDAALKKAGVAATAAPGDPKDPDQQPVDADSATDSDEGSALKTADGSMVTCEYTLSTGGHLSVSLTGVRKGLAIALMAPMLNRDGELAVADLETFVTRKFDDGKAVVTPGAESAAVAKLAASGGSAALEVAAESGQPNADGAAGRSPITGEPLRKLTDELVKQIKI